MLGGGDVENPQTLRFRGEQSHIRGINRGIEEKRFIRWVQGTHILEGGSNDLISQVVCAKVHIARPRRDDSSLIYGCFILIVF